MSNSLSNATILIVEDNPDNLFIGIEILRRAGARYCDGRPSGQQLFKLVETLGDQPIDVVLLDLQLPQEDGYAILTKIRDVPRFASARIVALTANVMTHDVERARAAGFDGFIGKPLSRHRFPDQVIRIIQGESVWEPR